MSRENEQTARSPVDLSVRELRDDLGADHRLPVGSAGVVDVDGCGEVDAVAAAVLDSYESQFVGLNTPSDHGQISVRQPVGETDPDLSVMLANGSVDGLVVHEPGDGRPVRALVRVGFAVFSPSPS